VDVCVWEIVDVEGEGEDGEGVDVVVVTEGTLRPRDFFVRLGTGIGAGSGSARVGCICGE
jgi:hypothetical protein